MRRSSRTTEDSLSRQMMRLLPVLFYATFLSALIRFQCFYLQSVSNVADRKSKVTPEYFWTKILKGIHMQDLQLS